MKMKNQFVMALISLFVGNAIAQAAEFQCSVITQDGQLKSISTKQGANSLVDGGISYFLSQGDGFIELYVKDTVTRDIVALSSAREESPFFSLLLPKLADGVDVSCQNMTIVAK